MADFARESMYLSFAYVFAESTWCGRCAIVFAIGDGSERTRRNLDAGQRRLFKLARKDETESAAACVTYEGCYDQPDGKQGFSGFDRRG
jgi:hypothetical protein